MMIVKPKRGRPTLGEHRLSKLEIRERYANRLKAGGGKTYTIRIKDGNAVKIIKRMVEERGEKSESALIRSLLVEAISSQC